MSVLLLKIKLSLTQEMTKAGELHKISGDAHIIGYESIRSGNEEYRVNGGLGRRIRRTIGASGKRV